jgi:N-methylhydantoinase A/oxoprolinase/acetone carboxylase beta subunit
VSLVRIGPNHFVSFSMPDVLSIGLGGGSRVRLAENGQVTVGPDSVGHQVSAYIFCPS